jgi:hypothetical protein
MMTTSPPTWVPHIVIHVDDDDDDDDDFKVELVHLFLAE